MSKKTRKLLQLELNYLLLSLSHAIKKNDFKEVKKIKKEIAKNQIESFKIDSSINEDNTKRR